MSGTDWIDARTVTETLGIKPASLYAYVSRGRIRARADPLDSRRSLYARHDVEALLSARSRPRARAEIAATAIRWGDPVMETEISGLVDGTLWFGASRAVDLARDQTLEQVAARHWRAAGADPGGAVVAGHAPLPLPAGADARSRGFAFLARAAAAETQAGPEASPGGISTPESAARMLGGFADALLGAALPGPVHLRCARAWGVDEAGQALLRRALVLISDHELNPSTFAVRIAASTGAGLAAALLAGFATLSGPRHGGVPERAGAALAAALAGGDEWAAFRAAQGAAPPYDWGFGHPLYPGGDPRAAMLIDGLPRGALRLRRSIPRMERDVGQPANVDMGLAALARALGLPADAGFTLFAIGRLAGWAGHAMEQAVRGQAIRPRARFRPRPAPGDS